MPKIIENPYEVILEHAKKILYSEGYEGLSIRNVAKSCGIGVGTIYNYFPTKRDLYIQMIIGYWEDYLDFLDNVSKEQGDIFEKLRKMYKQLESFVSTFKEVWIKLSMDKNCDNVHTGIEKRKDFIERLTRKLDGIFQDELSRHPEKFKIPLSSYETSNFIIQNLMMIALTNQFEYDSFEIVLKKLIQIEVVK